MDDTDISSHVNNLEPEGLSARDDARIVDAEMTAFKSADIATVGNLSASITAMNQSLISKQFAESIRALNRPLVNNWHVASTVSLNVNPRVVTTREEPQTWRARR